MDILHWADRMGELHIPLWWGPGRHGVGRFKPLIAQHAPACVARDLDAAADIGSVGEQIPALGLARAAQPDVLELTPQQTQIAHL